MAARWIACPFLRRDGQARPGQVGRWMMVQEFAAQITADGGAWDYFECGGGPGTTYTCGVGIVKVRASTATINSIIAAPNTRALPASLLELTDPMSVLGQAARDVLRNDFAPALGYTTVEVDSWLNAAPAGFNNKQLQHFFEFLAARWYRVVYEPVGSQVGYQGVTYPGVVACDGRTTSTGVTSSPWLPLPKTPAQVAASVPSV